jgi:hypothetical protein
VKRLLSFAPLLLFCAGALSAQTSTIVATTIVGSDNTPLATGKITWQPCDLNGNPLNVNLGATHGIMLPRPAVCFISAGAITTNTAGNACAVVDTSVTNTANFCYRVTIQDTVSGWTAPIMPCVQPSGSTWSLDTYVPPSSPTALVVAGPAGATGPAPSLAMGTVTTLSPGSNATAAIVGSSPNYSINLGLPQGAPGASFTGGAVTTPITLPGNPTSALQAAPKQYVDTETTRAETAEATKQTIDPNCKPDGSGNLACSTVAASATVSSSLPVADVRSPAFAGGAVGDDTHDDTAAFNAAIASLPNGGTVQACGGVFKITSTIYLTDGVFLRGCNPGGEPWLSTGTASSVIDASSFGNLNSWVIDTAVKNTGTQLPYNDFTAGGYGYISRTGVQGISIKTGGQTVSPIYGGIRMAFAPHALIRDVNIQGDNLGIAVTLNSCIECVVDNVHAKSNYFGLISVNGSNAATVTGSVFDEVFTPSQLTVPAGLFTSIFGSGFATTLSSQGLSATHGTSAKGATILAENGGSYGFEAQNWPDTVFIGNGAFGIAFPWIYTEGTSSGPGMVSYFYTESGSGGTGGASATISAVWCYTCGTLIDSGYDSRLTAFINGSSGSTNLFGHVSVGNGADRTAIAVYDYNGSLPTTLPVNVSIVNANNSVNLFQNLTVAQPVGYSTAPTGTIALGSHLAQGEMDFLQNKYTSSGNWAFWFAAANSGNTGWSELGGFTNDGTFNADNGYAIAGVKVIPSTAGGYQGANTGKVLLTNGTPTAGTYPDGASGTWTALPVTKSGTPTAGAGVCWKTTSTLGTCTAGTWPNCTTCN